MKKQLSQFELDNIHFHRVPGRILFWSVIAGTLIGLVFYMAKPANAQANDKTHASDMWAYNLKGQQLCHLTDRLINGVDTYGLETILGKNGNDLRVLTVIKPPVHKGHSSSITYDHFLPHHTLAHEVKLNTLTSIEGKNLSKWFEVIVEALPKKTAQNAPNNFQGCVFYAGIHGALLARTDAEIKTNGKIMAGRCTYIPDNENVKKLGTIKSMTVELMFRLHQTHSACEAWMYIDKPDDLDTCKRKEKERRNDKKPSVFTDIQFKFRAPYSVGEKTRLNLDKVVKAYKAKECALIK